jgi:hypothetical protein
LALDLQGFSFLIFRIRTNLALPARPSAVAGKPVFDCGDSHDE